MVQESENQSSQIHYNTEERSENSTYPPRSSFSMNRSPLRRKKFKEEETYKVQYLGMGITTACACLSMYNMYKCIKDMKLLLLASDFFRYFIYLAKNFPASLIFTLLSYFFVKAVLIPKYAGGSNVPKKFWPLSNAQAYFQFILWYNILELSRNVQTNIVNRNVITMNYMINILKRLDYKPLLMAIAITFVLSKYAHACTYDEKEWFAFIKPWIVDEGEDDEMDKTA